ncbi:substrate-binding periplasmic protein [Glaciecola sp. SC05]|uniref:substrate-binding periplasmic protein n=1 Tax=Glaciecola sp. SC05 TaxID=1987355 RepID=UPI0035272852
MLFFNRLALCILFISSQTAAKAVFASDDVNLQFYTHSIQEAVQTNAHGELVGVPKGGRRALDVEIIRWIIKDLNLKNNIQVLPFARALRKLQSEDNIAVFNILRTKERNDSVQWIGPMRRYRSYFYEAIARPQSLRDFDDAKKVDSVCVLNGNIHQTVLQSKGFSNLILANSYTQCVDLLLRGRVHLIASSENPYFMNNLERPTEIQRTPILIFSNDGYLALSLNVSLDTIIRLQSSIDKLLASEDYQRILTTYSAKK